MNKNKYKNMMFFAPDEGGGDGGGGDGAKAGAVAGGAGGGGEVSHGAEAFEPVPKSTTGDRPLPEKKPAETPAGAGPKGAETAPAGTEPVIPVAPVGFDPSKFAQEFGTTLGEQLKPLMEKAAPEAPMTPERARELLKVWTPDDNWFKSFDNLGTRNDAISQMRDGLILQADTLNQLRMQEAIDGLRKEIMPGLESVKQVEERARESRLHTQYPTLANPVLKPLLDAITTDFANNKKTFKTEGELFKALADGVEAVMKVNNPEFKLETASNGDQKPADRGGRQLPVTSPGGGGNTGRREGNDPAPLKRGLAVFDKK